MEESIDATALGQIAAESVGEVGGEAPDTAGSSGSRETG